MSGSVTICMPHWQVKQLLLPCLRSIRKHSQNYDVHVVVVDNGSNDESLDWLRDLEWIKLIERPEESPANWPRNVFTAWDRAIRECNTEYFITMHTDVFIKDDDWLNPFFTRMEESDNVAAVGGWKLSLGNSLYEWQKQFFGRLFSKMKGKKENSAEDLYGYFPRDYCAMYRVKPIVENNLEFSAEAEFGGGLPIMKQLWDLGYEHRMISIPELSEHIVHIAHGSAAVAAELTLRRKSAMRKVEKRVAELFAEPWVQELYQQNRWDRNDPTEGDY